MESLAAIFKDLYTSFLLRDLAGKIVPGSLLILAFTSLFVPLQQVIHTARGKVTITLIVLVAGSAWTIMLGLQSVSEAMNIWRYYPAVDDKGSPLLEIRVQRIVQCFLKIAAEADRQQYERYVVIKEATGNLFMSFLLSAPLVLISYFVFAQPGAIRSDLIGAPTKIAKIARLIIVVAVYLLITISLLIMNQEHVNKQYS